ncbi:hypothetical protein HY468_00085 [Candidatus Roizmanbacteria bacterium]|nr:hypothetical protein [Candidatus Roizmanbacteria bacterium]
MDNKVMVGLFVMLALIIGAIVIVRRNPNLLERLRINRETKEEEQVATEGATPAVNNTIEEAIEQGELTLTACSADIPTECSGVSYAPVCGYDRPTSGDKGATPRKLTYNNSCYYCQLYGQDGKLPMGDAAYEALGYTEGACSQ